MIIFKIKNSKEVAADFCSSLFSCGFSELRIILILILNQPIDKKSSHNPYTQDYARFFV